MTGRQRTTAFVMLVLGVGVALRVALALRPGLWADEVFSLAMATGHSLEHPTAVANAALGDYQEADDARTPSHWRSYLELGEPAAGPRRVVRAVFISDTNPPLYYLLLNGWARFAGTSDPAIRLFSVLWALASVPLLWRLSRQIAGWRVAATAVILFILSPVALHYSTEVRMYSMGWFLGLSIALVAVHLHQNPPRPVPVLLGALVGAAALLTHYFLAFVWLACILWLVIHPGRTPRRVVAISAAITVLLALPWFIHLPETLAAWRITAGWLDYPLTARRALLAPARLAWSLFSSHGSWGGSKVIEVLLAICFAGLIVFNLRRGVSRLLRPRMQLAWLWLLASVFGVLAFDLLRGTSASLISRYAVLGLPAAMILAALAINQLPRRAVPLFLVLVCAAWASGIRESFSPLARPHQPFPAIAASLVDTSSRPDVVIVHSIPSGVLGLARYLPAEVPLASWVVQLSGRRIPEDLMLLLAGRCRVAVVKIHDLGEPSPAEEWLRANATLVQATEWSVADRWMVAETLSFQPLRRAGSADDRCMEW